MDDRRAFYEKRAAFRPREGRRAYHDLLKTYYGFLAARRVIRGGWLRLGQPAGGQSSRLAGVASTSARAWSPWPERNIPNWNFTSRRRPDFSSDEKFDYDSVGPR
jgi:hypothetical protein